MKSLIKKSVAAVLCAVLAATSSGYLPDKLIDKSVLLHKVEAASTEVNIGFDLAGAENRPALRSSVLQDWIVSDAPKEVDGVTFKISSGSEGSAVLAKQNKTLVNITDTPFLTCDGVVLNPSISGGSIILEISGLPAGEHTLTSWHSQFNCADAATLGSMNVIVNGELKATVPTGKKVKTDDDAGIAYVSFTAEEGKTVRIEFKSGTDGNLNSPVLNAFELDGSHPVKAVKATVPTDNEEHFQGSSLSWTAGEDAVSHDVYFGTDEEAVRTGDHSSPAFMGNQTETSYSFTESLSHLNRYYWRVDEIDSAGNVTKGKTKWFDVVHLAFPTAEGYGRFAKAGRGGRIIEVTSLADTNEEGTLRWALETEKGPRIIVFKVGGIINLTGKIVIPNDGGNVYVAGQTAPGDGITLNNYSLGMIGANDVVIRNIRIRVGDMCGKACDGMGMSSSDHCIIDHCSIAWATDEGFSSRGAKNITFQHNIIAESLHDSVHYNAGDRTQTETHAFAASISGDIGSFHHNLLVDCTGRNWSLAGGLESDGKTPAGQVDIRNNVVYNYMNRTTDGGTRRINFVNNYYKMGAASRVMNIFTIDSSNDSDPNRQMAYLSGNVLVDRGGQYLLSTTDDPWKMAGSANTTIENCRINEPFYESYVKTETADEAFQSVVKNVGAMVPAWDYLDTRYIKETVNTSYTYKGSKQSIPGIIDSQEDAGGYPDDSKFKGGEAKTDSDHDGMPDDWETKHQLNPNDASDGGKVTLSAEGYTNVEMYLDELIGDPLIWAEEPAATATPVPATATPVSATATPVPATATPTTATATPAPASDTPAPASATPVPATSTPDTSYVPGDVNMDGSVNASDALLILKSAARLEKLDETQNKLADVNQDGNTNATDALGILKFAAKLIESFNSLK